jgi:poly(A) polymerase
MFKSISCPVIKKITLPNWLPIHSIEKLFSILAPYGESRLVGGCVRDIVAGKISKDLDIATTILPEQVSRLLVSKKFKVIPTGIKHGTITTIIDEKVFEITTLRKDIECFGRHAKVEFTDDWKEDALRRDFTINAMSMDTFGQVYDYFGGVSDLQTGIIRFVGIANDRINEDYLRILRYFRFYSYFGGDHIDKQSLKAVVDNAGHMMHLSGERIRNEIMRLLSERYVKDSVLLMTKNQIWEHLKLASPEVKLIKKYAFTEQPLVNLAALLRSTAEPEINLVNITIRWRLSNKERSVLQLLCDPRYEIDHQSLIHTKRLAYLIGMNNALLKLQLKQIENPKVNFHDHYTLLQNFKIPKFPINGKDVKKAGFDGKEIGQKLSILIDEWINSDFKLKRPDLLHLLVNL